MKSCSNLFAGRFAGCILPIPACTASHRARSLGGILIIALFLAMLFGCKSPAKKEITSLPFYNTPDFTPHWIDSSDADYSRIHTIAPFSFTNQLGQSISNKNVAGKIYVANFFFTWCQSVCPGMMSNLAKLQQTFANDSSVLLLSHSVTPLRDDVATLAKYGTKHQINPKNWWLLTGDKEQIYTLARQSYFAENDNGFNKKTGDFLHTENLILIDKHGRIRGVYNGSLMLEVDHLIDHIRLLEREN